MVGVDLGLGAGGQLLPGVLVHRGELRGLDSGAVTRREVDLLRSELGVHFVPDEVMGPGQSRVMMPWDWIGIVTIRSDTRRS